MRSRLLSPCLLVVLLASCKKEVPVEDTTAFRGELVKAVQGVEARSKARPVRGRPVIPGSFGAAFDVHAADGVELTRARTRSRECIVPFGKDDPRKASCALDLAPSRDALVAMLALTASEQGGTPPSVHPFAPLPPGAGAHATLDATCSRAGAEVDLAVADQRAPQAVTTCVRALELARDYSLGASLAGGMAVAQCIERLEAPCQRALDAAVTSGAGPKEDLAAIHASLPPFHELADTEVAASHLVGCGWVLLPAERAQLSPVALSAAAASEGRVATVPAEQRNREAGFCRDGFAAGQVVARSMHAAPGSPERAKILEDGKATIAAALIHPQDLGQFEARWDRARASVQALASRPPPAATDAGAPQSLKPDASPSL